jgi:hypothetical protein
VKPIVKKYGCFWIVLREHPYYGRAYDRCYDKWIDAIKDALR